MSANPAVAAAVAAGRDLGLTVVEPRVLYEAFSVVVHLAPAPVVVRAPTVLPPPLDRDLAALTARQRDELAVAGGLADRGHPVVRPSPLVPREPVVRDEFSLTFWEFVDMDDEAPADYVRHAADTAELHAALRGHDGQLPFLTPVDESIPASLAALESRPDLLAEADLDRARREWAALEPIVTSRSGFRTAFPQARTQPIHGDSPVYNRITTRDAHLWADFEMAGIGPVEWDLRLVGPAGEAAYNAAATRRGMPTLDENLLRILESVGMVQAVAALALVPRLPMLAEGLRPMLAQWRDMPFAGGLV